MAKSFDLVVIGSGPGGYVAAIRAAQLGMKVAVVEREKLGGVCLNVGCIPSKAMIAATHFLHKAQHSANVMGISFSKVEVDFKKMVSWKQSVCDRMSQGVAGLLKGNQIEVVAGEAEFRSASEVSIKATNGIQTLTAKHFLIATGSRPIEIPGFPIDEKGIMTSTGALALSDVPKSMAVIGGGYIGLEIAGYYTKLGTKVTVLEAASEVLSGVVDPECAAVVVKNLKKQGVEIWTQAKAKSQKKSKAGFELEVEREGKVQSISVEKILVTVGRRPNGDQGNLRAAGVQVDAKGFVQVNAARRTSVPHIFAIGDVAGQPMLAHKASHEGVMVAEILSGKNRVFDAKTVPAVVFTDPEIASVGWTEAEAKTKGHPELKVGKFPFAANGRAVSILETEGFVKIVADAKTHVVLGVQMVGPEVSNLISEAALAIEMGARLEDLALTIHPHPTLGETMMEAAEAALGHAIHVLQKRVTHS